jgi:hypothetical protein
MTGSRQIYVSNVCTALSASMSPVPAIMCFSDANDIKLPYTVGWQDLKDLFRQAGRSTCICQDVPRSGEEPETDKVAI